MYKLSVTFCPGLAFITSCTLSTKAPSNENSIFPRLWRHSLLQYAPVS